jgi:uncharacterized protein YjbI with pentapeptide repeats
MPANMSVATADMTGANLREVIVTGQLSFFQHALMVQLQVNFSGFQLSSAKMNNADLTSANLTAANLSKADCKRFFDSTQIPLPYNSSLFQF